MRSDKFVFMSASGHELAARMEQPAGQPRAYALFAHCFTCGKDSLAASRIARALTEHDIAVLRFDFTGIGGSDGEFANSNFSSNVEDLVAAADHLRDRFSAPAILIGHSLGGAAMLAAAGRIPEAQAVATIGAPYQPRHVAHLFADHLPEIESEGHSQVTLASGRFEINRQFVDDLDRHDPAESIGNLRKALLVLHSPTDEFVGIDNAASIFQAARHPKSFISLDSADHLLTAKRDAAYCAAVLSAWASRYIGMNARDESREDRSAEKDVVTVSETGDGKFQQRVVAGRHYLTADEPESVGGTDTGPSPYDLLLAGLGACTGMTIRMYADRKAITLDRVSVTLRHDRIHAEDCADCETTTGTVDRITRTIVLDGVESDEDRARLMAIADKCPVHKTLTNEIDIVTIGGA